MTTAKYTFRIDYADGRTVDNPADNKSEAAACARSICDGSRPEISRVRVIDNKTGRTLCEYARGRTRARCVVAPRF